MAYESKANQIAGTSLCPSLMRVRLGMPAGGSSKRVQAVQAMVRQAPPGETSSTDLGCPPAAARTPRAPALLALCCRCCLCCHCCCYRCCRCCCPCRFCSRWRCCHCCCRCRCRCCCRCSRCGLALVCRHLLLLLLLGERSRLPLPTQYPPVLQHQWHPLCPAASSWVQGHPQPSWLLREPAPGPGGGGVRAGLAG